MHQSEPQTLLDVLTANQARRGSAPAILAPGRSPLSYAALYDQIDHIGTIFAAMGLGRNSRIGLSMGSGPEAAATILATMIWATAVPLGPEQDVDACVDLLTRLRIDALAVLDAEDSPMVDAARTVRLRLVRLSSCRTDAAGVVTSSAAAASGSHSRAPPRPDTVAVLLQTSGTTALPKIVPITHAQLLWSACQQPIDEHDRFLSMGSIFNSSGLMNAVLAPLATGAATVITGAYDWARFVEWLDEFKPTYFSAGPTVLASILDALAQRKPAAPHSLRFIRAGGSALPPAIQLRLESVLGIPVIQGYGMTEAGSIAQNPLPPRERRTGSVGVAFASEVMILRDNVEASLDSGVGEILVRGPGVMSGYENDTVANGRAFRDGWFRTGDLGRIDDDGYLFITGRLTELINRGGVMVSPSEVDATFMRHPAVREAATFAMPHPSLGEDVVTAIVLRGPGATTAQALRSYGLGQLPPSKAPSSVVLVDAIPKDLIGKIGRGALRERFQAALCVEFVAPRDDDEALVATIFAEVLALPRVGALDNFFRLGGDSLRGGMVLVRVGDRCGVHMDMRALFESPTVAEFADRLRAAARSASTRPIAERIAIRSHRPLAAHQEADLPPDQD